MTFVQNTVNVRSKPDATIAEKTPGISVEKRKKRRVGGSGGGGLQVCSVKGH